MNKHPRKTPAPPLVLNDGQLYTQADVCAFLGITEWTCRRRMKEGKLPYRKDGAWLRFTAADLRTYLERTGQGQPLLNGEVSSPKGLLH